MYKLKHDFLKQISFIVFDNFFMNKHIKHKTRAPFRLHHEGKSIQHEAFSFEGQL